MIESEAVMLNMKCNEVLTSSVMFKNPHTNRRVRGRVIGVCRYGVDVLYSAKNLSARVRWADILSIEDN